MPACNVLNYLWFIVREDSVAIGYRPLQLIEHKHIGLRLSQRWLVLNNEYEEIKDLFLQQFYCFARLKFHDRSHFFLVHVEHIIERDQE